jgi:uncharacterized protein YndB with AHSA1/START domain
VRIELEHVVAHPVERVFAFMADVRNRPLWQENTHDVELIDSGEPRRGMRWRETMKGVGTYEAELVSFERDRLWTEATDVAGGSGRIEVAFAPEDGGAATRLRIAVDIKLRGTKKIMEPALGPKIRRQMPSDLHRLEALLDGDGGSAPA